MAKLSLEACSNTVPHDKILLSDRALGPLKYMYNVV